MNCYTCQQEIKGKTFIAIIHTSREEYKREFCGISCLLNYIRNIHVDSNKYEIGSEDIA